MVSEPSGGKLRAEGLSDLWVTWSEFFVATPEAFWRLSRCLHCFVWHAASLRPRKNRDIALHLDRGGAAVV